MIKYRRKNSLPERGPPDILVPLKLPTSKIFDASSWSVENDWTRRKRLSLFIYEEKNERSLSIAIFL